MVIENHQKLKNQIIDKKALHSSLGMSFFVDNYAGMEAKKVDIDEYSNEHPIVRTHPETKRKAIFVNRNFTTKIEGLSQSESNSILNFLYDHCEKLEYQIRYRWNKNDMAFWDNRCTMHRAMWDYHPMERKGRRVTIKGEKPF